MGCKLDDFKVDAVFKADELNRDSFNFINYTGRQVAYSQGSHGQDVVVATLDTGVSPHPEFGNRLLPGKNCIKNYGNTSWKDDNCHGTHTASTIVGGVYCGIASEAFVLPVKVLGADGSGEWADVTAALYYVKGWASNGRKVKIISMSLSGGEGDITETEKTNLHNAIKACKAAGMTIICSAGNTAKDEKRYPACFPEVIAVTATDWNKELADYSTWGTHVKLTQNGTKIIGAYYLGEYLQLSGTSMSAPMVSGIAAVLVRLIAMKYDKDIMDIDLDAELLTKTKDIGPQGIDNKFGNGFCTLQPLVLSFEFEVNSPIIKVNGVPVIMDFPTQIVNGRTVVALRDIVEAFGGVLSWAPQNEVHNTKAFAEL